MDLDRVTCMLPVSITHVYLVAGLYNEIIIAEQRIAYLKNNKGERVEGYVHVHVISKRNRLYMYM